MQTNRSRRSFVGALMQGRFGDHPIHPMVVHLPVGLLVASLIFDLAHAFTGAPALAVTGHYCAALGILGGVVAAIFGMVEFSYTPRDSKPRQLTIVHAVLNVVVLGIFIVNYMLRVGQSDRLSATSLVLSVIGVAVLGASGYIGGTLVYRYGIGLHPETRPVGHGKSSGIRRDEDIDRAA